MLQSPWTCEDNLTENTNKLFLVVELPFLWEGGGVLWRVRGGDKHFFPMKLSFLGHVLSICKEYHHINDFKKII